MRHEQKNCFKKEDHREEKMKTEKKKNIQRSESKILSSATKKAQN